MRWCRAERKRRTAMRDVLFSFVVNATWQAALTAGLGMLFARFLRSPRQRFELLALTLVASFAAPALTLTPRGVAAAHEHAHVRRNDSLLHVAIEILALPLYFHPMVYRLRRSIGEAREMACDEQAAARRGRRKYAEALVRLASLTAGRGSAFAIGMAATSVERRVRALLASDAAGEAAGGPAG